MCTDNCHSRIRGREKIAVEICFMAKSSRKKFSPSVKIEPATVRIPGGKRDNAGQVSLTVNKTRIIQVVDHINTKQCLQMDLL